MLRELSVQNLALIEDVRVELMPGFCAWTGETGAGKSLLLGALGLILGERGSVELIREGAEELRVTAAFELTSPDQRTEIEQILNGPLEDEEIILARRFNRNGRSSSLINDHPVALATLREVGAVLVDIHGQRESHSLLQPSYQLELLDAFGKLTDQRQHYLKIAEEVRSLRRKRAELAEQREHRQRELSLLRFEREELDAAELKASEMNALEQERQTLLHAQALQTFTMRGAGLLYDEEGAVAELLGKLLKEAEHWAEVNSDLKNLAERLAALLPEVQDLAETCRNLSERFEANPARLEQIEKRIEFLDRLESKYKRSIHDLIDYRDSLDQIEVDLQQQEDDLVEVEEELTRAFRELGGVADKLSKARKRVAKKLVKETQAHLADLGMPQAQLDAVLETEPLGDDPLTGDVPSAGIDHLELMLAANPGEPARALRKIISGGEMARTMLALKTVLAAHDPVGTLVFDEIDANVGGRLGDVLGRKLAALGQSHQVICVTHLPQVAAYAAHQWTIRKQSVGKRTITSITPLTTDKQRVEELASMLRGESRGATTRKEATEMLKAAQKNR